MFIFYILFQSKIGGANFLGLLKGEALPRLHLPRSTSFPRSAKLPSMAAAILAFSKLQLHGSPYRNPITPTCIFSRKLNSSSSPHMTINAISTSQYSGVTETSRSSGTVNGKIYRRLGSCLVIPPTKGRKPKALIKFLGGAFVGAVPEVTYR